MLVKSVVTIGLQRYLFYLVLDDSKQTSLWKSYNESFVGTCRESLQLYYYNGRSDRASLQRATRHALTRWRGGGSRYSSHCATASPRGDLRFSTWGLHFWVDASLESYVPYRLNATRAAHITMSCSRSRSDDLGRDDWIRTSDLTPPRRAL